MATTPFFKESSAALFIVDNSDSDWKVRSYLHEWCELSRTIDSATSYFESGALLALQGATFHVEHIVRSGGAANHSRETTLTGVASTL